MQLRAPMAAGVAGAMAPAPRKVVRVAMALTGTQRTVLVVAQEALLVTVWPEAQALLVARAGSMAVVVLRAVVAARVVLVPRALLPLLTLRLLWLLLHRRRSPLLRQAPQRSPKEIRPLSRGACRVQRLFQSVG